MIKNQRVYSVWSSVFGLLFLGSSLVYAEPEKGSFARAERLFLEEKYDKAVDETDKLIEERASRRDEVYYLKGLSEIKLNRFGPARSNFEAILAKYPGSPKAFDAYLGIGDAYLLQGDKDMAMKTYNEMLKKFPGNRNITMVQARLNDLSRKNDERPVIKTETAGYFSVQVGCFKNRKNAERLNQKLLKVGYNSFMEGPSSGLYRVKAGRFKSREGADVLASKLQTAGYTTRICDTDE